MNRQSPESRESVTFRPFVYSFPHDVLGAKRRLAKPNVDGARVILFVKSIFFLKVIDVDHVTRGCPI